MLSRACFTFRRFATLNASSITSHTDSKSLVASVKAADVAGSDACSVGALMAGLKDLDFEDDNHEVVEAVEKYFKS